MTHSNTEEREELVRAGRLHWIHWCVVGLSLVLTLIAFSVTRQQGEARVKARFENEAQNVVDLVLEHMRVYENALLGGVAAHDAAAGVLEYSEWKTFAKSLRIDKRYPGINGIGVIHSVGQAELDEYLRKQRLERPDFKVFPEHSQPEYLPITYAEPSNLNAKAIGLDIAHEANRYEAAKLARATGSTTITGPIVLAQDAEKTPGFLFYAPYYKPGYDGDQAGRQENFLGAVYAPFIMTKLMAGTLEKERRRIGIRISDGSDVLYDEHITDESDFDPSPLFTFHKDIELYGRTWSFDARSAMSFRSASRTAQPWIILVGGVLIDGLLLSVLLFLSRANRRAISYADKMNSELRERSEQLERSNLDLERFAYVASHDMRTPLRGVGSLVDYLGEDLEDYLASEDANPDVGRNLGRISEQVGRMDSLIKGVLEFASLEHAEAHIEAVDLEQLMTDVATDAGLGSKEFTVTCDAPEIETEKSQLIQVLGNLVSNAAKYHHDPANLHVHLTARTQGDRVEISIADNGPGINPRHHDRIFEAFRTLQPKDVIDSTGIGLAIVKKTVERYAGKITIESAEGRGATFSFTWPRHITLRKTDQVELS
ncbi:MAG: signal transduction histidine kinase [Planctomycetota bacterium]|jgi:signal transduction histidine kinase